MRQAYEDVRRAVKHPLAAVIGLLLVGYATTVSLSQTRQTVTSLQALTGTWEGSVRDVLAIGDTVTITLKIKEGGSYTWSPSRGNSLTGQLSLNGGQLSFQSSRPASGTVILFEGDGKRILRFTSTEGSTDFTAVK